MEGTFLEFSFFFFFFFLQHNMKHAELVSGLAMILEREIESLLRRYQLDTNENSTLIEHTAQSISNSKPLKGIKIRLQ